MATFRKRSCYIRHFTSDMSHQIAPCLHMTCCILHFAIWLNNRLAFCIVEKHSACLLHFELVSGPACLTQMLALGLAILIAWMALLGGAGLATQMLALFWQRVRVGFSLHVSSNPVRSLAERLLIGQQLPWKVLPFRPPLAPENPEQSSHSPSHMRQDCGSECELPPQMLLPDINAAPLGDRSATNSIWFHRASPGTHPSPNGQAIDLNLNILQTLHFCI